MIFQIAFFLWASYAYIRLVVQGEQVFDQLGCQSLKNILRSPQYIKNQQCQIENVEIYPYFYTKADEVNDIDECYKMCIDNDSCLYYTYVIPKSNQASNQKKMCYLKGDFAQYVTMKQTVRVHIDSTAYSYTSGFRNNCSITCTETDEVLPGCHSSSVASCSALGYRYDATLRTESKSVQFPCCDTASVPDKSFLMSRVIKGSRSIKTFLTGIHHQHECHTQCLKTPTCTAWNHVTSPLTQYVGGACYLIVSESLTGIKYEQITAKNAVSTAAVNCTQNGSCSTSQFGSYQDVFLEETSSDSCTYANLDLEHFFDIKHEVNTVDGCKYECLRSIGCNYWMFKWNKCHLAYSNFDYKKNTMPQDESTVGYRTCDRRSFETCLLFDSEYVGTIVLDGQYTQTAFICLQLCQADGRCVGWSYSKTKCYIFSTISGSRKSPTWVSGLNTCKP